MILYFSATGNTRFVAEELAKALGDEAHDLRDRIKRSDYGPIRSERPFVLCAPTYVCEAPRFFNEYVRNADFEGSQDLYFISTNGGYSGISGNVIRSIVRKKGMRYRGCADFCLPPNYIAGKGHRRIDDEEIERRVSAAREKIVQVAEAMSAGEDLSYRHVWLLETAIDAPLNPVLSWMGHRTRGFHASDACVSCGLCERLCPVNAIGLSEGRPLWRGYTCAHCMACIQNCPTGAIEYRDITQGRPRYRFASYHGVTEGGC